MVDADQGNSTSAAYSIRFLLVCSRFADMDDSQCSRTSSLSCGQAQI